MKVGSLIICLSNVHSKSNLPKFLNYSSTVYVHVGPLSMVTEIKRNSSTITWKAPFSLDLTGVDPDIVLLCGGVQHHLWSG